MIWALNFHRFCRDVPVYVTRRNNSTRFVETLQWLELTNEGARQVSRSKATANQRSEQRETESVPPRCLAKAAF
jgi:hypothetical protein